VPKLHRLKKLVCFSSDPWLHEITCMLGVHSSAQHLTPLFKLKWVLDEFLRSWGPRDVLDCTHPPYKRTLWGNSCKNCWNLWRCFAATWR
jgi:hypothetical protein